MVSNIGVQVARAMLIINHYVNSLSPILHHLRALAADLMATSFSTAICGSPGNISVSWSHSVAVSNGRPLPTAVHDHRSELGTTPIRPTAGQLICEPAGVLQARGWSRARRESQDLENFHGKKLHINKKIERVLQALEAAGEKK